MIWYVVKNELGEMYLLENTQEVPEGHEILVETVNENYIIENTITPEQQLQIQKAARAELVNNIVVSTSVGEFDGDEDAQRRMTSAITAMTDEDSLPWVLHNNTVVTVTKQQLLEVLRLSGLEMATIWVAPYTSGN